MDFAVTMRESRKDPANNALLANFRLSSEPEIFVDKYRLSTQIGTKTCKNVHATCAHVPTDLPFRMPPLVVGEEEEEEEDARDFLTRCSFPFSSIPKDVKQQRA